MIPNLLVFIKKIIKINIYKKIIKIYIYKFISYLISNDFLFKRYTSICIDKFRFKTPY